MLYGTFQPKLAKEKYCVQSLPKSVYIRLLQTGGKRAFLRALQCIKSLKCKESLYIAQSVHIVLWGKIVQLTMYDSLHKS